MQEPDFRTISDFRKDRITDIKILFKQVLATCRELGMIKCGQISIDGTKLEANSSRNKVTFHKALEKRRDKYEEKVKEIMDEAERVDAEEDKLYGDSDGYSLKRPYSPEEIKKALKKIKHEKARLERKTEQVKDKLDIVNDKINRLGNNRSA
jgi:transposase